MPSNAAKMPGAKAKVEIPVPPNHAERVCLQGGQVPRAEESKWLVSAAPRFRDQYIKQPPFSKEST